jgi:hypothetical protein
VGSRGVLSKALRAAALMSRTRGGAGAGGAAAAQQPAGRAGVLRLPGGKADAGCWGFQPCSCARCMADGTWFQVAPSRHIWAPSIAGLCSPALIVFQGLVLGLYVIADTLTKPWLMLV